MRAIDLYSGIGGWCLGLKLAGIEVVASYEWWLPALTTHAENFGHTQSLVDIRKLQFSDLPASIDLVVGSPPCTEFSYANRGGQGNVAEGLKDLVKFLEIVDYLNPKYWVLENVPRVAKVLQYGFSNPQHVLYRFRHLKPEILVVDFSNYGAPQARKRCIAGNIPFEVLKSYSARVQRRTLGNVINSLAQEPIVVDPVWGHKIIADELTEMQKEAPLNGEELRMNRDSKEFHPVYNNMSFPDILSQPARTVTATCTRVSRESIIIEDPSEKDSFRRLTIRERASLQGFPITYQFYGKSFAEKAKMIGNSIPPTFTFLLAQAVLGKSQNEFQSFEDVSQNLTIPSKKTKLTVPDSEGKAYSKKRRFRAAIPELRFKSGMRFELSNNIELKEPFWNISFYFGSSKDIQKVNLRSESYNEIKYSPLFSKFLIQIENKLLSLEDVLSSTTPQNLQLRWAHKIQGIGPYEVVDLLGDISKYLIEEISIYASSETKSEITKYVSTILEQSIGNSPLPGKAKIEKNAISILTGLFLGGWFNALKWHKLP